MQKPSQSFLNLFFFWNSSTKVFSCGFKIMFKRREVDYYLEIVSCVQFKPWNIHKCILSDEASRKQSLLKHYFFYIYSLRPKVIPLYNSENELCRRFLLSPILVDCNTDVSLQILRSISVQFLWSKSPDNCFWQNRPFFYNVKYFSN